MSAMFVARRFILRYGLGCLAALLALLIRWPLWVIVGTTRPYLTFYPAIILSGWCHVVSARALLRRCSAHFSSSSAWIASISLVDRITLRAGRCSWSPDSMLPRRLRNSGCGLRRRETLESQEKLRLSEERSKYILESISDGFVAMDQNFQVTDINSAAERILHLSRGDVIGKNFWQQFPEQVGTATETSFRRKRCHKRNRSGSEYLDRQNESLV